MTVATAARLCLMTCLIAQSLVRRDEIDPEQRVHQSDFARVWFAEPSNVSPTLIAGNRLPAIESTRPSHSRRAARWSVTGQSI